MVQNFGQINESNIRQNISNDSVSELTPVISEAPTRRPLTCYEQFFHDDPRRPVSEGKMMLIAAKLTHHMAGRAQLQVGGKRSALTFVQDAAEASWLHTCRTWRYLRHVVENSSDADGDPMLVEKTMEHVEGNLSRTVRVFDARDVALTSETDGMDSDDERLAVSILDQMKRLACSVHVSTGTVCVALETPAESSLELLRMTVGIFLSHSAADGGTLTAVFRTLLEALDAALSLLPLPQVDAATAAAGAIVARGEHGIPLQRILESPLVLPVPVPGVDILPPLPPTGVLPNGASRSVSHVHLALSEVETSQLLALTKQAKVSVQALISVAFALATAAGSPTSPAKETLLGRGAAGGRPAAFRSFCSTHLRHMCEPPLPANAAVVGGAGMWLTTVVHPGMGLMELVRATGAELRRALAEGRHYGFFKMYLRPPGADKTPTWAFISQRQAGSSGVANFTTASTTFLPRNAVESRLQRSTNGMEKQKASVLDFPDGCSGGTVNYTSTAPPTDYIRTSALVFQGRLCFHVSFTSPTYERATVKTLLRDVVFIFRKAVRILLAEEVDASLSAVTLGLIRTAHDSGQQTVAKL
jgi:hypothetical protein